MQFPHLRSANKITTHQSLIEKILLPNKETIPEEKLLRINESTIFVCEGFQPSSV